MSDGTRPATSALIDFLNQLLKVDRDAIEELLETRVSCNQQLANHPTVQVLAELHDGVWQNHVGLLGILNGFCGAYNSGPKKGWGPIGAMYDGGKLVCFERLKNE